MSYLEQHTAARPVPNTANGEWARLRRFLVLGSESATYDTSDRPLTRRNATAVETCIRADGRRAVAEIVRVSDEGRAPTHDPALFALAMAAGLGDTETRRTALDALPQVARAGAHLLRFAAFVEDFRGWGRTLRRAVAAWYAAQPVEALARQAITDRRREGMAHRDLLRLAHPGRTLSAGNPAIGLTTDHERLFEWIARGRSTDGLPRVVEGFARAQAAKTPAATARLVADYRLPRDAVRPEHLNAPEVWEALLAEMPIAALVRDLAKLTRVGVLAPGSVGTAAVAADLADDERIRRARLHPIALLSALRTYAAGRPLRGRARARWAPVADVVDALDAAFSTAVRNVEPTGRRILLALDVSESMAWGDVAGLPGLTPRHASTAMALVTAATEPDHEIVGFLGDGLTPIHLSPRRRRDCALRMVDGLPFGPTDCALPMRYAKAHEREVDTFVIYTDAETWHGDVHPAQALREYRAASGIDARLVVVGMASNGFSIADPADAGMLDVVGFDVATPQLIADFARHAV